MTGAFAQSAAPSAGAVSWPVWGLRVLLGLPIILAALAYAWSFPTAPEALALGLLFYVAVLFAFPSAWLIVVPAFLPVLELSYWSGRIFFTEFDLLLMATIGAALCRRGRGLTEIDRNSGLLALIILGWSALVTWQGLRGSLLPGVESWSGYLGADNALRETKGFFWALLLLPILSLERAQGTPIGRLFSIGMMAGLVLAGGTILWERLLFTGLFNFSDAYRVSGWFFGMHTGGAAIDAFLILAAPFAVAPYLLWRNPTIQALAAPLLGLTVYCLYVTYSRANYPAAGAMAAVLLVAGVIATGWRPRWSRNELRLFGLASLGVVIVVALLVSGRNIQSRFAESAKDLDTRLTHWSKSLDLMDERPLTSLIGMGRGVFPRSYFWGEAKSGEQLAVAALAENQGDRFVRLSKSDESGTLFLRQRFTPTRDNKYDLALRMRSLTDAPERLLVEFCERHMLKYLEECQWVGFNVEPSGGGWVEYHQPVNLGSLGRASRGPFTRPLEISILVRGIRSGIEITSVQLKGSNGDLLLKNPGFQAGQDHWFVSYGDHLRWHIKNVLVHLYFEGGALGLLVFAAVMTVAAVQLTRAVFMGKPFAALLASALAGTVLVGAFDSLFDEPRITLIFVLAVWLAVLSPNLMGETAAAVAARGDTPTDRSQRRRKQAEPEPHQPEPHQSEPYRPSPRGNKPTRRPPRRIDRFRKPADKPDG